MEGVATEARRIVEEFVTRFPGSELRMVREFEDCLGEVLRGGRVLEGEAFWVEIGKVGKRRNVERYGLEATNRCTAEVEKLMASD